MAKISLSKPTAGYNLAAINNNFTALESEFQNKVLYRDNPTGEPNSMAVDLDMNSNDILNVASINGVPISPSGGVLVDIDAMNAIYNDTVVAKDEAVDAAATAVAVANSLSGTNSVQRFSGDGVTTSFSIAVPTGSLNVTVYIGGIYQQTNTWSHVGSNIIFTAAPPAGANNIEVVIDASIPTGSVNPADFAPISHVGSAGSAHSVASVSVDGFMSAADKAKLDALAAPSYPTGMVKGNGVALSAAVAGTDYLTPTGNISATTGLTSGQVTTALGFTPLSSTGNISGTTGLTSTQVNTALGYTAGYKEIPQVSQSAAYTLVLNDGGKHIYHPSVDTTARTWTIPANASVAFPVGTAITFVNDTSAGAITISITTDTLVLAGAGTTGSRTLAANGVATAIKITSTRWIISGSGLT